MGQAALYRRYRSRSFADVVGQDHITKLLAEAIRRGTISHAYLFTGPRGVGKTSVARILAHEINELPYSDDTHLDIIEIDAASNRRIDDIRDLREKVHITPVSAKYKVYIIDEVHMLTGESFNALLKTLEEPPAHVVFILATTEIQKVPATIISRTQRFQFRPGITASVSDHLKSIAVKEKITIDDVALERIARHGGGSFRDSVGLLDQLSSIASGSISVSDVDELLGLVPSDQLDILISSMKDHDMERAITTTRQLQKDGAASSVLASQLARELAERAQTAQDFSSIEQLLDVAKSTQPDLKLLTVIARVSSADSSLHPREASSKPQSKAVAITPPTPIISKEITAIEIKPIVEEIATVIEDVTPITTVTPNNTRTTAGQEVDWDQAMTQLAKRHPPLHSVLKRAEMSHEGEALVLEFKHTLHQKKLEDSKYRMILVSLVTDLFGTCPEIIIRKKLAKPPQNQTAAEVAAIMGGGEEVNAT